MRDLIAEIEHVDQRKLRRAWPRSRQELTLEYVVRNDEGGGILAATWSEADGVRFVPPELDSALPGLASVVSERRAELVSHRVGRRAVVRLGDEYVKVVRPRKAAHLVERLRVAEQLPIGTAPIRSVDTKLGVVRLARLEGLRLTETIGAEAADRIGLALRELHSSAADALPAHTAMDERKIVEKWLDYLGWLRPDLEAGARSRATRVLAALDRPAPTASVPIHRDLHDGQFVLGADGSVAVLDFDTLARGEPALDVANLLVHFELAALLGSTPHATVDAACSALLAAYEPPAGIADRISVYADATRIRLTCVHAFRPGHLHSAEALLQRIAQR